MNKQEFEQNLRKHLDVLMKEECEKEISFYLERIQETEQQGLSEVEAVKSLGNIEDILKTIYEKRGIDYTKVYKKHGFVYQKFEQLFQVIHRLVDVMSKNSFKGNAKIVIDILILFAFVAIIKIPFIVVQNLGDTLLGYFSIPALADVWSLILDCIYIVVAVIVFINIFQKYFAHIQIDKKNIEVDKPKPVNVKSLESISLEEKKEE